MSLAWFLGRIHTRVLFQLPTTEKREVIHDNLLGYSLNRMKVSLGLYFFSFMCLFSALVAWRIAENVVVRQVNAATKLYTPWTGMGAKV
jgi:hypothetical protein